MNELLCLIQPDNHLMCESCNGSGEIIDVIEKRDSILVGISENNGSFIIKNYYIQTINENICPECDGCGYLEKPTLKNIYNNDAAINKKSINDINNTINSRKNKNIKTCEKSDIDNMHTCFNNENYHYIDSYIISRGMNKYVEQ